MKLSEQWLREWVNPALKTNQLIERLNMAGLAVESCTPVGNDYIFEFELTPNRGDCLSVQGIAREVAALTDSPIKKNALDKLSVSKKSISFNVTVQAPEKCPYYEGAILEGIHAKGITPAWMQERLEKSDLKIIHPVVDVLNYVMIELGQPLHAFDLSKLTKEIIVRNAKPDEEILLLDGRTVKLEKETLVIADQKKPHAIAGIMGGLYSSVTAETKTIFIESAHFTPAAIAGKGRQYALHTDASHRFERGVDPALPSIALARAVNLLKEIYPTLNVEQLIAVENKLAKKSSITLRHTRVEKLLGMTIDPKKCVDFMKKLEMTVENHGENTWHVMAPSYRFDIDAEIDLIEEIIRLQGYSTIPVKKTTPVLSATFVQETQLSLTRLKQCMIDQGFHEVITYSFVDPQWQQWCDPQCKPLVLANPLASTMGVMRTNLWAGLLQTVQYNLNRQQNDLRLFETGLRFRQQEKTLHKQQEAVLSGVMVGNAYAEQWGQPRRAVDFFDAKKIIEILFQLTGKAHTLIWQPTSHPALHPGQSAAIYFDNQLVGCVGVLHPELQHTLDFTVPVILFEIILDGLTKTTLPVFQEISKFPAIRRDIALLVDRQITVADLTAAMRALTKTYLIDSWVFDVYQGKNMPDNKKSIALSLIFQAPDRTLIEEDIQQSMNKIVRQLTVQFHASLRE